MKIKIWGTRGSVPAPIRPGAIREKVIAALQGLAKLETAAQAELLTALAELGLNHDPDDPRHKQNRQLINRYLDRLSPLAATTAGGNTPCIEIQSGKDIFIIDAGTGIRDLGTELMNGPCGRGEGVLHLFFSHPHWDHIQGFPFFRPAFIPGNKIFMYGVHDMHSALRRQQEFISFPIPLDYMQATKTFIPIKPDEVLEFGDVRIRNMCNQHPGDSYSFRFEKGNKIFVYASDSSYPEGMDLRPYLNFFSEADLLIFDAQFTQRESDEKEDWGHSSSFVGVEMAQQAKVKNLLLYHYDPTYSDQDLEKILDDTLKFQQNQYPTAPPVNVMIAQEEQVFNLTPAQSTQIQQVPGSKASILKPIGIFDEYVAISLREKLNEMAGSNSPSQLIIDMSRVEMLQVAGLRGLVKLRKEHQSIPIALAALTNNARQLIELAGYLDFFAIYPSVHVALNALKARETLNLPGQVLKKRYRIESKIGEGRLGTVFMATDLQQHQPVAIKILSPSFSETAIEQFLQQARQIINLTHPNVVTVL
jgi:anti-anti-sigma factor